MKRRLAIVSLVVCGAAVATASSNDLMVARHALRDELWEVARRHASAAGTNEESRLILTSDSSVKSLKYCPAAALAVTAPKITCSALSGSSIPRVPVRSSNRVWRLAL